MAELKTLYEALGVKDVTSYIQSGNVVFNSATAISPQTIELAIKKKYGFDVPVIIRSKNEWKKTINSSPFAQDADKDPSKLHVVFLADKPKKETEQLLTSLKDGDEDFHIKDKEIYLYCPHGYGRSRLSNNNIEKASGSSTTTRNWKTVNKLLDIADSL